LIFARYRRGRRLQGAVAKFDVVPSQSIGLAVTSVALAPTSVNFARVRVYNTLGQEIWTFQVDRTRHGQIYSLPTNLPAGRYSVVVLPDGNATLSFGITLSAALTGTLAPEVSQPLTIGLPGQLALLSFTASANQTVAINVTLQSITPYKALRYSILNSSGTQVGSGVLGFGGGTGHTENLRNLAAGTYTVRLYIEEGATGTFNVILKNGLTGTLTADGSNAAFSSSTPGQYGHFTFTASAGDTLSLAVTDVAAPPQNNVLVYAPNGAEIASRRFYNTSVTWSALWLENLVAGTYRIEVQPDGYSTSSYKLTLAHAVTGTLSVGTPVNMNLDARGRFAKYTFTAAAGESFALTIGSIVTTPERLGLRLRPLNTGRPVS
jgi:hypothetical protein